MLVFLLGGRGFNGALDTYVTQAYGAGTKQMCGIYLNRGRIAVLIYLTPASIVLLFASSILQLFGIPENIADVAGIYLRYNLPGIILMAYFETLRRFLFAIKKAHIPMICQIVATALHFVWCCLLISKLDMGVYGAGLAMTITYTLNFLFLHLYSWLDQELQDFWMPIFSMKTLANLKQYLCLAFNSYLFMCIPFWAIAFSSYISYTISVEALRVQVILYSMAYFY